MRPQAEILRHFTYGHLPAHLAAVSRPFCVLAAQMDQHLPPDDPETTESLRRLLDAKDAAVRAAVVAHSAAPATHDNE